MGDKFKPKTVFADADGRYPEPVYGPADPSNPQSPMPVVSVTAARHAEFPHGCAAGR